MRGVFCNTSEVLFTYGNVFRMRNVAKRKLKKLFRAAADDFAEPRIHLQKVASLRVNERNSGGRALEDRTEVALGLCRFFAVRYIVGKDAHDWCFETVGSKSAVIFAEALVSVSGP